MTAVDELFLATCVGCGLPFLAGTGDDDDPMLDPTYEPIWKLFVCDECYSDTPVRTMQRWMKPNSN